MNKFKAINNNMGIFLKLIKTEDKGLLLKIFLILSLMKVLLIILPFSRFRIFYERLDKRRIVCKEKELLVIKYINILERYAPLKFTCLHKALALKYFLKGDSNVELILGVLNDSGNFEAHAWVVRSDAVLIGEVQHTNFKPIWVWK